MLRRLEELDRIDARHGLGTDPRWVPPPTRRPSSGGLTRRGAVPAAVVVVLLVGSALAVAPAAAPLRALLGLEDRGDVPAYEAGTGSYSFLATQPGTDEPVGYDPCQVLEVEVNPDGAPGDHRELVEDAVRRLGAASGLRIEVVGETDLRSAQHDRATREGAAPPVLVTWAGEDDDAELAGDVLGYAGSSSVTFGSRTRYVTGQVVLDAPDFRTLADEPAGRALRESVVVHELAHVLGLGHVDDRGELMHPETGALDLGPGDREGLARLGSIPCG